MPACGKRSFALGINAPYQSNEVSSLTPLLLKAIQFRVESFLCRDVFLRFFCLFIFVFVLSSLSFIHYITRDAGEGILRGEGFGVSDTKCHVCERKLLVLWLSGSGTVILPGRTKQPRFGSTAHVFFFEFLFISNWLLVIGRSGLKVRGSFAKHEGSTDMAVSGLLGTRRYLFGSLNPGSS